MIHRRGDDGRDLRAVVVVDAEQGLRVHQRRVRTASELLVRDVQTGVDDGDGLAGAGRDDRIGADRTAPPLLRCKRFLGRSRRVRARCLRRGRRDESKEDEDKGKGAARQVHSVTAL